MTVEAQQISKQYRRPLIVGLVLATFGELLIFLIFGVLLYPEGDLLSKFLWTVLFCGVGMGFTMGALIDLLVVERFKGAQAITACCVISILVLGFGCNFLCFTLDQHFHYFGGQHSPRIFIINGVIMAAVGGLLSGWLHFTKSGSRILDRVGI